MNSSPHGMIYGANGYTGRLVAREAVARGLKPILAGRNHEKVLAMAAELGCQGLGFSLEQPARIAEHIAGCTTVVNCAGPFSKTAQPMMEACMSAGADYLDITGEIDVIEAAAARNQRAQAAGVALVPAVGFDVVPSDCLAAMLAQRLPGAKVLQLAFTASDGFSPGTAKTMVEAFPTGGRARIDGEIRHVPTAWKSMDIPFRHRTLSAMTIPWGDVASAYYSTGIGNIEVYTAAPLKQIAQLRRFRFLLGIFGWRPLAALATRYIDRNIKGPTPDELEKSRSSLWGRVSDDDGHSVSGTLETLGGYKLTALTTVAALERSLQRQVPRGFSTASQAFGAEFILSFPNTDVCWQEPAAARA